MAQIAVSIIFSLLVPGAGHIYRGENIKGLFFGLVFVLGKTVLFPLYVRFSRPDRNAMLKSASWFNIAYAVLIAISVLDNVLYSVEAHRNGVAGHTHIWLALMFALAAVSAFVNLKRFTVLGDMISGVKGCMDIFSARS